ncbi:MAG: tetratricopeptide repeat protein [Candidatus Binataceae bacterium]
MALKATNPAPVGIEGDAAPAAFQSGSVWIAAIVLVTTLVYLRCVGFDFVLDDRIWVNNRYIGDWSFAWKSIVHDSWWFHDPHHLPQSPYYRPLQGILATVLFHLFGTDPAGWHAAMIALHLAVVWMVYRVAVLLTGNQWAALFASAMYGLMPQNAQVVIWSTVTDLPMNAAFELAAFEFFLRGRAKAAAGAPRSRDLALSLGFFACALLSYDSAVTFPVLVAVYVFLFPSDIANLTPCPPSPSGKGERKSESSPLHLWGGVSSGARAAIAAVWSYLIVVAAYLAVRLLIFRSLIPSFPHNAMTAREMLLTIPSALWGYAMLLLMPWRAFPAAHDLAIVRGAAEPGFYLPVAGLIALCAAAVLLLWRSSHRRLYLFCAAWILIALAPALDLRGLRANLTFADRYLYFPAFGFCVMAADLAVTLAQAGAIATTAIQAAAGIVIIAYGAMLFYGEQFWRNDFALYSHCVAEYPEVGIWHTRLGLILAARGDFARARRELTEGIAHDPATDGNALYALGLVDEELGDRKAAEQAMIKGMARFDHPPLIAYTELAVAADAAGDKKQSEAALARAAAQPGGAEAAELTRAKLRFIHGDAAGSEKLLAELLKRDPNYAPALIFLGTVLKAGNRFADALEAYRRASKLDPYDPSLHYHAALMLHALGRDGEARKECALAIAQAPGDNQARALMLAIGRGAANRTPQ